MSIKYLKIYIKLVQMNFTQLITYRVGFYSNLAGSIVWGTFQFISVFLLTSKNGSFFGWSREELFILTGVFSIFWGVFHIFLARNFSEISRIIDYGNLDTILARPISPQFYLSVSRINFTGIYRIILGVVILVILFGKTHISVSLLNILGTGIFGLFGIILMYSIWFITSTCLIWYPRLSNLIDFLYNISGIIRQPPEMITHARNEFLMMLLPLALVVSTPTRFLINKGSFGTGMLLLFFSLVFFYISRRFFKYALKSYTSASG